jgi:hypothetical protein
VQMRKLTLNEEHNSECYSPTKRDIYVINNACIHNVVIRTQHFVIKDQSLTSEEILR